MTGGDAAGALEMIEESRPEQEWEEAVASCLQVLCRTVGRLPAQGAVGEMVRRCMKVLQGPAPVVFSVRLGLAAAELAENSGGTVPDALVSHLAAKAAEDGRAARDVLASRRGALSEEQAEVLEGVRWLPASVPGAWRPHRSRRPPAPSMQRERLSSPHWRPNQSKSGERSIRDSPEECSDFSGEGVIMRSKGIENS
ncbi:hypothetical protein [Nocardiopsis composta]|uniref:Uncharacterized protein n=1 Tax=Nocardiopsis composta TaxID=157465 RepID=A0A7W8QHX5_9ACTN|nr:hypothetical protein [Nocardiopsis composta]MBB5429921.1 hypothetical protein [Nocardiopsis composta]